jgi:hypothetical protein
MQKAVSSNDWKVMGPALVRMKKLSDGSILQSTLLKIKATLDAVGLDGSATMRDFIKENIQADAESLGLPSNVVDMLVQRCLAEPGSPTLVQIRKNADKSDHETINDFVKECPTRLKDYVRPIELAINDFAVELLKGLKSTLIDDTDAEVMRLRSEVEKAVSTSN